MASRIFDSNGGSAPRADTVNSAGGVAYSLSAKEALAQLAVTGCFNQTFYVRAEDQLAKVKDLVVQCDPEFIGKVAAYSREKGFMKDMPAFLLAHLAGRAARASVGEEATALRGALVEAFPRVVDNGKMLRNFVQILRSGEAGRKSLGSGPRRLVQSWFDARTDDQVFFQSIGNRPSMGDVVALAHPRPATRERAALFGYLRGRTGGKFEGQGFAVADALPAVVAAYERFKRDPSGEIPGVPFEMLEGLPLSQGQWKELALRQSWQSLRQRLNLFLMKDAFSEGPKYEPDQAVIQAVAAKLRDPEAIRRAKAMPYQLMVAHRYANPAMPCEIIRALEDAMEIATKNIPFVDDVTCVCVDVSGSMHSPVTGYQINPKTGQVETHTTEIRCIDVAALLAASYLRVNRRAKVIPFHHEAILSPKLNPRARVVVNAERLANMPSGGTACSAALAEINRQGLRPALVVFVSDNESWVDSRWGRTQTEMMWEWKALKRRRPDAKLVCVDLTPNTTTQARSREDILNVGGFSDQVFAVIRAFVEGSAGSWVDIIEKGSDRPGTVDTKQPG